MKAQAFHQLGRTKEARAAFDIAVAKIPAELLQSPEGPPDPDRLLSSEATHGDWLILSILKRQTEAVLKHPPGKM